MNHLTKRYENIGFSELSRVCSIREVAAVTGLSYNGVIYHINESNFTAVQTLDNRWLVWLPSVILKLGEPPHPGVRIRQLDFDDISEGSAGIYRWGNRR